MNLTAQAIAHIYAVSLLLAVLHAISSMFLACQVSFFLSICSFHWSPHIIAAVINRLIVIKATVNPKLHSLYLTFMYIQLTRMNTSHTPVIVFISSSLPAAIRLRSIGYLIRFGIHRRFALSCIFIAFDISILEVSVPIIDNASAQFIERLVNPPFSR